MTTCLDELACFLPACQPRGRLHNEWILLSVNGPVKWSERIKKVSVALNRTSIEPMAGGTQPKPSLN